MVRSAFGIAVSYKAQEGSYKMMAAKTFQEWYAYFGGEEMFVSRDEAAVVWEAATKAAEMRFTSHNNQKTPFRCPQCGKEHFPKQVYCSECCEW